MTPTEYSYLKTFWKFARTILTVLLPGETALMMLPDTHTDFEAHWVLYVFAIAMASLRAAENIVKTSSLDNSPMKSLNPTP